MKIGPLVSKIYSRQDFVYFLWPLLSPYTRIKWQRQCTSMAKWHSCVFWFMNIGSLVSDSWTLFCGPFGGFCRGHTAKWPNTIELHIDSHRSQIFFELQRSVQWLPRYGPGNFGVKKKTRSNAICGPPLRGRAHTKISISHVTLSKHTVSDSHNIASKHHFNISFT